MSGDEVLQFRVAPSRGASCTEGEWTDVTSGDGSFSFEPLTNERGQAHVQVRVKPPFVPGYYRLKASECKLGTASVFWITDPGDSMVTNPDRYERVEVTPVVD